MNSKLKALIVMGLIVAAGAVIVVKEQGKEQNNTTLEEIEQTPGTESLPKLVDLGAGKCVPCKMMKPILDELRLEYQGIFEVVFIDVWEQPDQAKLYNVQIIPTQIFYDAAGNELFRHEGFYSKEDILKKWQALGINIDLTIEE